jgi:nucleotide-binding universal stress UspA family protein
MTENAYDKILVPYDGSKFSQMALQTAKILAKAYGSIIYLSTVVEISDVPSPGLIRSKETRKTFDQIKYSIRRSVETVLEQREQECKHEGIKISTHISEGSVSDELLKFIIRNNIDLVVIGSQGLSGFSKLKALGSVSRKISELATCPVMIVR